MEEKEVWVLIGCYIYAWTWNGVRKVHKKMGKGYNWFTLIAWCIRKELSISDKKNVQTHALQLIQYYETHQEKICGAIELNWGCLHK